MECKQPFAGTEMALKNAHKLTETFIFTGEGLPEITLSQKV
jgi:hypothetical protein